MIKANQSMELVAATTVADKMTTRGEIKMSTKEEIKMSIKGETMDRPADKSTATAVTEVDTKVRDSSSIMHLNMRVRTMGHRHTRVRIININNNNGSNTLLTSISNSSRAITLTITCASTHRELNQLHRISNNSNYKDRAASHLSSLRIQSYSSHNSPLILWDS
jgi:hypothetical protein